MDKSPQTTTTNITPRVPQLVRMFVYFYFQFVFFFFFTIGDYQLLLLLLNSRRMIHDIFLVFLIFSFIVIRIMDGHVCCIAIIIFFFSLVQLLSILVMNIIRSIYYRIETIFHCSWECCCFFLSLCCSYYYYYYYYSTILSNIKAIVIIFFDLKFTLVALNWFYCFQIIYIGVKKFVC